MDAAEGSNFACGDLIVGVLSTRAPRVLDVEAVQMVQPWIGQIDEAFDRSVHPRIASHD